MLESSLSRIIEKPGKPITSLYDKLKETVGRLFYREWMRASRQKKSSVGWCYVILNP